MSLPTHLSNSSAGPKRPLTKTQIALLDRIRAEGGGIHRQKGRQGGSGVLRQREAGWNRAHRTLEGSWTPRSARGRLISRHHAVIPSCVSAK